MFSVLAGGGSLASTSAAAGSDGQIVVPGWTLGTSATDQKVRVTVGAATATVTASVQTAFKIELRPFGDPLTPAQQQVFAYAVDRIRGFILDALPQADLSPVSNPPCGDQDIPATSGITDAVIIYVSVQKFDGIGGLLGLSKLCNRRGVDDGRTLVGMLILDFADLNYDYPAMQLTAVHEMIHLLGFGDWNGRGLLTGYNTPEVAYTGARAIAACRTVGGLNACASSVPVEYRGGNGSANSHWREPEFGAELMTAFYHPNAALSIVTVKSMEDLGYSVNVAGADSYKLALDNVSSSIFYGSGRSQRQWEIFVPLPPAHRRAR